MKISFRYVLKSILLILCITLAIETNAQNISAKDIVNPQKICVSCYVSDSDDLLSQETENKINNLLSSLRKSTTAQVAVVAINGESNTSARDLSMELFDLWGVGQKGADNGLIILLCVNSREVFIRTGYGLEGALPDAIASQIVNERMASFFKQGNWNEGMLIGVETVCEILYKEFEENGFAKPEPIDYKPYLWAYLIICLAFLIAIPLIINSKLKKISANDKTEKITVLHKTAIPYIIAGILLFPALFLLLIWIYLIKPKRIRKKVVKCSCGNTMRLLSESQEDEYLDAIKQLEESLGSRDYDVWLCDKCDTTRVYPYDKTLSGYDKCPSCGAKTYKKKYDTIVRSSSVTKEGLMKTVFECKNCKYKNEKLSVLPKEVPFVVTGGIGGNSRGGSSFGGWGGGFSGGGGGGGRF